MSSEEEDDYMSDKFLTAVVKEDVRPGLILKRSLKRVHEMEKKAAEMKKVKCQKEVEVEKREEGLSRPIAPDNKGFALLQKMGFKAGSGLGKTGEGRKEPVGIEVKANREGLGRKEALREMAELKMRMMEEARKKALNTHDFRSRVAETIAERDIKADLRKSQKACYNLDSREGIMEPEELWFWPEIVTKKDEKKEDEEEEEEDKQEEEEQELSESCKLDLITFYLRRTYFYCIWCGVEYNDQQDLLNDCPGDQRNDH